MADFDVIVVGAGPAGSTLARELAGQGAHALLIEKERMPRYKACAGGVTIRAAKLLDFDISPVVERTVFGGRISYKLVKKHERLSDRALVYMTSRDKLDYLLTTQAGKAGAVIHDGERVLNIEKAGNSFRVETSKGDYTSRVLAGADGANGIVAALLGLNRGFDYAVGLEAEVTTSDRTLARWGKLIGADLGAIPAGYGWLFPKSDHLSIGAAGYMPFVKKIKPYLDELIPHYCPDGYEVRSLKGSLMRVRNNRKAPITAGGALLIGEAAGLVNAFTGEGIFYAIKSAKLAAPAVMEYLQGEAPDFNGYITAIDRELSPELGLSYSLARFALNHGLGASRPFFSSVISNKQLWHTLGDVLAGERTYNEIRQKHLELRPLVYLMNG